MIWYCYGTKRLNFTIYCEKKWESCGSFCAPRFLQMQELFKQYANDWYLVFWIDNIHLSSYSTATRKTRRTRIIVMVTAYGNGHLMNCKVVVKSLLTPDICCCWKPLGLLVWEDLRLSSWIVFYVLSSPCTKLSRNWYIVVCVFHNKNRSPIVEFTHAHVLMFHCHQGSVV